MAYIKKEEDEATTSPGMGVLSPTAPAPEDLTAKGEAIPPELISGAPGAEIETGTAAPTSTAKSGRFVNVQKYIEANRPQIQNLAKKMQENVQKSRQAIQESAQKQQSQLQERIAPEQQRLEGAKERAQMAIAQAGTKEFTPEELQKFQALRTGAGQYQTISPLDLSKQRIKARALETLGKRITEGGGREQLLRETITGPNYTLGQRKLDEMLLSSDPTIRRQALAGIKQATTGIEGGVTEQERIAREALGGVRATAADIAKSTQQKISEARSGIQETLTAKQAEELTRRPEIQKKIVRNIEGMPDWARESSALTLSLPEITESRVATPEQLARVNALAQLGGYEQTAIPDKALVGTYEGDVQQAGEQYQQSAKTLYQDFKNTLTDTYNVPGTSFAGIPLFDRIDPVEIASLTSDKILEIAQQNPEVDPYQYEDTDIRKMGDVIRTITKGQLGANTRLGIIDALTKPYTKAIVDRGLEEYTANLNNLMEGHGYSKIPITSKIGLTPVGTPEPLE